MAYECEFDDSVDEGLVPKGLGLDDYNDLAPAELAELEERERTVAAQLEATGITHFSQIMGVEPIDQEIWQGSVPGRVGIDPLVQDVGGTVTPLDTETLLGQIVMTRAYEPDSDRSSKASNN